jgi:N-methylhydantoinase A/oxoprolinase/acetone carboxylase beta subunit
MTRKERIYVIACGVLTIDIKRIAGEMGLHLGTRFMEGGLHENPYERLQGKPALLKALLSTRRTTADILVVPPGQVTLFDPRQGGLKAGPLLAHTAVKNKAHSKIEVLKGPRSESEHWLQTGLGIDAGGTYTDAVLYDLLSGEVLCKNKALTTKWDFTIGIREALTGLDEALLPRTGLVSVSTTLATNAVVEGEGQKVGLLIMPPYGLFENGDIPYEPKAVISGSLEISGTPITPVDEAQVRRVARSMVDHKGVEAFAVSGYAGSINPEHELQVKRILREETGYMVTCGHELSDLLNFRTRAQTAVLNARIVPRLERLITHLQEVLDGMEVSAPVMVVKGDGSLMSSSMAIERPVETILSGPAASVAGARFLTGQENAVVVDMGGTTTDTAALEHGKVRVAEQGSQVGGSRTHVKALEIRTSGLGGDSLISYAGNEFTIGPRRVAPMAWLGRRSPGPASALEYARQRSPIRTGSSKALQFFTLTGHSLHLEMTEGEARIVDLLKHRPYSMDELTDRTGAIYEGALPLARLEKNYIIQRCGLTPTDLLHVTGQFDRWDRGTSRKMCDMFAALCGMNMEEMVVLLLDKVVQRLALELIKKQLDAETQADDMDRCDVCRVMMANLFKGGAKDYSVHFTLNRPVIGVGAPIAHFLPQAAKLLGTKAILPEHADVANAIGAITSQIAVRRKLKIKPDQGGGFLIEGLAGALHFETLEEAEAHAKRELVLMVRKIARAAGTSQTTVEMQVEDQSAKTANGDELFLERSVVAQLIGKPDIAPTRPPGARRNRTQPGASA